MHIRNGVRRVEFGELSLLHLLRLSTPSARQGGSIMRVHLRRECAAHNVCSSSSEQLFFSTQRRFISGRQATFSEIAESLSILGVPISISEKELKLKYRELVKKHHPDTGGSEAQMSKVSVAYQTIQGLSTKEKEQFEIQKRSYNPGASRGGYTAARSGNNRAGYTQRTSPYEGTGYDQSWQQQHDYARSYQQSRQNYYAYQRGATGGTSAGNPFSQNPFTTSGNPFNMSRNFRGFSRMSTSGLLIRGIAAYFAVSIMVAYLYRSYRDWAHDDGWRQAESLSRHEQLQELYRIRQEMKEKMSSVDAQRENQQQQQGSSMMGGFGGPLMRSAQLRQDEERIKELRALEYAQRRQMEMQQLELKGWPRVDPLKGHLSKSPSDPVGVVYFEPADEGSGAPSSSSVSNTTGQQRTPYGAVIVPQKTTPQSPSEDATAPQKQSVLAQIMRDQERQQAEFLARQASARTGAPPGSGNASGNGAPEPPGTLHPGVFSFQSPFTPPPKNTPV